MYLTFCLGFLAFCGHLMFWVSVNNKLHSIPLNYKTIRWLEKLIYAITGLIPTAWLMLITYVGVDRLQSNFFWQHGFVTALYFILSWCTLVVGVPAWLHQRLSSEPPCLLSHRSTVLEITDATGRRPIGDCLAGKVFAAIPKNELFQLDVAEKELRVPNLPAGLDSLSIAHLSDLHFTGRIAQSYFDHVVDHANAMNADLAVITGDIIDETKCLDWIAPTLGRLRAKHGVFWLLGNHDKRLPDVAHERQLLNDAGLIEIGNRSQLLEIDGEKLRLVGNELPWFGPAPAVERRDRGNSTAMELRILLAHTPDQIEWGSKHDFDLMLAGHTHGGQIRFPFFGPMVAPSWYGVRYASGVFMRGSMVMHVSRGISGVDPVRFNCPPELAKLVLRQSQSCGA